MRYRYLFYVLLLIPVFIFRDYTPANELKYISIVSEALENGTWFTFYNHGEIYADKPPLFFWLIMLCKQITGDYPMWFLGLFSLLPAIGIMAVMDKWLKDEDVTFNPLLSNLMLLTTAIFLVGAMAIRMDILMTFFIVLSLYTFYALYRNRHVRAATYLLPVFIFLAVFTKGPVGLLVPVVSIVTFLIIKKEFRTIGRYLGWRQIGIFLALCAVWFMLIYLEGGQEYLHNTLFKQTVGRGVNSFHHKEPVWFYIPRMLWTFAPWSLLFVTLLWQGIRKRMIKTDLEKFFLTVIVVTLVMLSLVSSKIDIYLLPIYPFVVYLCSIFLVRSPELRAVKLSVGIPAVLFALSFPLLLIFKHKIPELYTQHTAAYIGVVILSACSLFALVMICKKQVLKAIGAVCSGIFGLLFIGSLMLPQLNKQIGFQEMAETAKQEAYEKQIDRYIYYRFYTAANMDVYIERELDCIKSVHELDSIHKLPYKSILFVRSAEVRQEKDFKEWLSNVDCKWSNGRYSWYVLGKDNP